jgi:hypothetical protein
MPRRGALADGLTDLCHDTLLAAVARYENLGNKRLYIDVQTGSSSLVAILHEPTRALCNTPEGRIPEDVRVCIPISDYSLSPSMLLEDSEAGTF